MRDCPPPFGARGGEEHCFPQQCNGSIADPPRSGPGPTPTEPRPYETLERHQHASHTPPMPFNNPQNCRHPCGGFSFLPPRRPSCDLISVLLLVYRWTLGLRRSHDLAPVNQARWPMLTTTVRLLEVSAPSGRLSMQNFPRIPNWKARTSSSVDTRVCCRDSRRR